MRALPTVLSFAALGASAFSLVLSYGLSKDLREKAIDPSLEPRLARLEAALDDGKSAGPSAPRLLSPLPSSRDETAAAIADTAAGSGAPAPLAAGARPVSAADLERRLEDLEKRLREREPNPALVQTAEPPVFAAPAIAFLHSADDAAKHLELSGSQRADFERAIEDAKREIDVIRKTPDETGETWEKAEKETVSYQNGGISIDGSRLTAFREKVMPGRSESFGGAMRRVREEGFRRMKSTLSPAQAERFSQASTDGLLPGGSDMFSMFSITTGPFEATTTAPESK